MLLAMACGAVPAQDNVQLYGVVDAGIRYDKTSARNGVWSLSSGNRQGSRLGIRGGATLGPGMRAVYTVETGFNADDGTLGNGSRLFGRQSWLGLESAFGTFSVGRQYSALYLSLKTIDPFRIQEAGDMQRMFAYGLAKLDPFARADNSLIYSTSTGRAWQAKLGHRFGESAQAGRRGDSSFAEFGYESARWKLRAAWQDSRDLALGASAAQAGGLVHVAGLDAAPARVRALFAGAVLDLGILKLHGGGGDTRVLAGKPLVIRNLLLGVSVPIGDVSLMASFNRNALRNIADSESGQLAAGAAWRLSKRTDLYASASRTRNQHAVALNSGRRGASASEMRTGVSHAF